MYVASGAAPLGVVRLGRHSSLSSFLGYYLRTFSVVGNGSSRQVPNAGSWPSLVCNFSYCSTSITAWDGGVPKYITTSLSSRSSSHSSSHHHHHRTTSSSSSNNDHPSKEDQPPLGTTGEGFGHPPQQQIHDSSFRQADHIIDNSFKEHLQPITHNTTTTNKRINYQRSTTGGDRKKLVDRKKKKIEPLQQISNWGDTSGEDEARELLFGISKVDNKGLHQPTTKFALFHRTKSQAKRNQLNSRIYIEGEGDWEDESTESIKTRLFQEIHTKYENDSKCAPHLLRTINRRVLMEILRSIESAPSLPTASSHGPNPRQLWLLAISSCIPFIGFGFVDNFVMLVAGDYFDTGLCVVLGFSTMAAAALGNLISDLMGIGLGGYIERVTHVLGFAQPNMTRMQMEAPKSRLWYHCGSAVGVAIGCVLGMIPLLFLDTHAAERLKQERQQEELFGTVMEETAKYLHAQQAILFLVKEKAEVQGEDYITSGDARSGGGDELITGVYSLNTTINNIINRVGRDKKEKLDEVKRAGAGEEAREVEFLTTISGVEHRVPIDAGIAGQVYRTGKLVNWRTSHSEPLLSSSSRLLTSIMPRASSTIPSSNSSPSPLPSSSPSSSCTSAPNSPTTLSFAFPSTTPPSFPSSFSSSPSSSISDPPATQQRELLVLGGRGPAARSLVLFPQETNTTKFPQTEPAITPRDAKQILGAPVFGATGRIIGVVEVMNPIDKEMFSRRDKEFLIVICSHLAIEIEGKQDMSSILKMCRRQVSSRFKQEKL